MDEIDLRAGKEVRDAVKSAARNLAGLGSDYGVRLELPNHLKSSMRAIQSVSYDLKMKHPQVRRNVLFDDDTMDVVLDFNLSEDQPWMRLTSEQAKKRKKKNPTAKQNVNDCDLDNILGSAASSETE